WCQLENRGAVEPNERLRTIRAGFRAVDHPEAVGDQFPGRRFAGEGPAHNRRGVCGGVARFVGPAPGHVQGVERPKLVTPAFHLGLRLSRYQGDDFTEWVNVVRQRPAGWERGGAGTETAGPELT